MEINLCVRSTGGDFSKIIDCCCRHNILTQNLTSATAAPPTSRLLLPTLFSISRKQVPAASLFHNLYGRHKRFVSQKVCPMQSAAQELLQKVAGWDMANDNGTLKLHRSWTVKSFTKGLDFFSRIADDIAESEGHHPDFHLVGWNNVKINRWTHAIGGLTENDFSLAAKINELQVEDLLRKKKVAK